MVPRRPAQGACLAIGHNPAASGGPSHLRVALALCPAQLPWAAWRWSPGRWCPGPGTPDLHIEWGKGDSVDFRGQQGSGGSEGCVTAPIFGDFPVNVPTPLLVSRPFWCLIWQGSHCSGCFLAAGVSWDATLSFSFLLLSKWVLLSFQRYFLSTSPARGAGTWWRFRCCVCPP